MVMPSPSLSGHCTFVLTTDHVLERLGGFTFLIRWVSWPLRGRTMMLCLVDTSQYLRGYLCDIFVACRCHRISDVSMACPPACYDDYSD